MKVEKTIDIKTRFEFEALVVDAAISGDRRVQQTGTVNCLDLNDFMSINPDDTFLVRVSGESMIDENIFDTDILVVSRNEEPVSGKIVIASLNGEMAVKKFVVKEAQAYLVSANKKFLPIAIQPFMEFRIHGVVKFVVHSF